MQRQRGLTLLELLVVLAIIGLAMAGVSLSLRDSQQTQLEREAQRLVAVLEAARAQSRTSGVGLIWQTTAEGFVVRPALTPLPTPRNNNGFMATADSAASPIGARAATWLTPSTQAQVYSPTPATNNATLPPNSVVLGPEPIVPAARITLSVARTDNTQAAPSLSIGTDGLTPFHVVP